MANPSPPINTSGINKASIGLLQTYPIQTAPQMNKEGTNKAEVLAWGIERAKRKPPIFNGFNGYCLGFATVVIAILVAKDSQLQAERVVEQFTSGAAATGHTYVVVNRAPGSDINDPTTWGADCAVVDVWYSLQTDTDPVKRTAAWWATQPPDR